MKKYSILFMALLLIFCIYGEGVNALTAYVTLNPIADGVLGNNVLIKGQLMDLSVDTIIVKISKPLGNDAYALYDVRAIPAVSFIQGFLLPTTTDNSIMPAGRYRIAVGYDTYKAEETFLLESPSSASRDIEDNTGSSRGGNTGGGGIAVPPEKPIVPPDAIHNGKFADITPEFVWAQTAIEFLYEKGIVNGTGEHVFSPDRSITRAEICQLIAKLFDFQEASALSASDVSQEDWFYTAISKLSAAGIIFGYEDGTFRPDNFISREEMAVMLHRALDSAKRTADRDIVSFLDTDEISPWAVQAVATLKGMNLINGKGNNRFSPKDILSRAEAAQVIYNTYISIHGE